jgi:hypothetical protein
MKIKLLSQFFAIGSISLFIANTAIAQQNINVDSQQYQQMKMAGTLPQQINIQGNNSMNNNIANFPNSNQAATVTTNSEYNCNCLIPLDTTFSIVPFANSTPPYYTNDDGSTNAIVLPFSFCYYGQQIDSIYINNNGNISFSNQYPTFSSEAFPSQNFNMIAPFWGDVDTRGQTGSVVVDSLGNPIDTIPTTPYLGLVHYKMTSSALIIKWEEVGYFSMQGDKRNTFQLIITDGLDSIVPGGNNVSFCYGDMQWTTGAASSGVNGFGGVPATVGANKGDGINYFQVGRFDHAGIDYDGPSGNPDGISFLDNSAYLISTCTSNNNVPPIALTSVCDSINLSPGDTTIIQMVFVGPEIGQEVSAVVNFQNPNYSIISNISGNPCVVTLQCIGTLQEPNNYISVIATDNGVPAASTTQTVHIVSPSLITSISKNNSSQSVIHPNPSNGLVNINFNVEGQKQVKLFNSIGSLILTENSVSNNLLLNISNQAKGLYFVEINNGKTIEVQKLIIE